MFAVVSTVSCISVALLVTLTGYSVAELGIRGKSDAAGRHTTDL